MKLRSSLLLLSGIFMLTVLCSHSIRPRKIRKQLKRSEILNDHFTGFALYDISSRKMLVEVQSDKYFTPASNTKLFTFYTALNMLGDSIPGLQVTEKGDSLIFSGTGDPTFLHPDFSSSSLLKKLQSSKKKLFWAQGKYRGDFYGTGWSYDDYNEYYQPEISELPLYGNIIRLTAAGDSLSSSPALGPNGIFKLSTDSSRTNGKFSIRRALTENIFYKPVVSLTAKYNQEIPFKTSPEVINSLLKLSLPSYQGTVKYNQAEASTIWYSEKRDTVLKHMMLPSDNFIAEHLLLSCASAKQLPLSAEATINYALKNFLSDLPDKPQWVDGSGLSRQDLFTPRDMVKLCEKIYDKVGNEDKLFSLLPQGGKAGTIRNYFKSESQPFVFAKTGSLSNNYNLTGYVKTRSGKTLIFSLMNNNFVRPTSEIRKEVERIITYIHEH